MEFFPTKFAKISRENDLSPLAFNKAPATSLVSAVMSRKGRIGIFHSSTETKEQESPPVLHRDPNEESACPVVLNIHYSPKEGVRHVPPPKIVERPERHIRISTPRNVTSNVMLSAMNTNVPQERPTSRNGVKCFTGSSTKAKALLQCDAGFTPAHPPVGSNTKWDRREKTPVDNVRKLIQQHVAQRNGGIRSFWVAAQRGMLGDPAMLSQGPDVNSRSVVTLASFKEQMEAMLSMSIELSHLRQAIWGRDDPQRFTVTFQDFVKAFTQ